MAVADRTHDILRAACRVIAERGCDGMRMGDVARAAGVSSALVHYYFDTRSELLRRAFLYADEQVDAFIQSAVARAARRRASGSRRRCSPTSSTTRRSSRAGASGPRCCGPRSTSPRCGRTSRSPIARGSTEVAEHVRACAGPPVDDAASAARLCALVDGLAQQALLGGIGRARARALVRQAIAAELQA